MRPQPTGKAPTYVTYPHKISGPARQSATVAKLYEELSDLEIAIARTDAQESANLGIPLSETERALLGAGPGSFSGRVTYVTHVNS